MRHHARDLVATSPAPGVPRLRELVCVLDELLQVGEFPQEPGGVIKHSARPVRRLGLTLDPRPDTEQWIRSHALDAVMLHRHWNLNLERVPDGVGIVAYHLPFDERLTLGYNLLLAETLGVSDPESLGSKQGRPIGMIGDLEPSEFGEVHARLRREFGGMEEVVPPREATVQRIAVAGAMTDALVREAAARGAGVYLTGQLRAPARRAVEQTGIGVLTTGHRRAEEWGLRALAAWLRRRWAMLETHIVGEQAREPL